MGAWGTASPNHIQTIRANRGHRATAIGGAICHQMGHILGLTRENLLYLSSFDGYRVGPYGVTRLPV